MNPGKFSAFGGFAPPLDTAGGDSRPPVLPPCFSHLGYGPASIPAKYGTTCKGSCVTCLCLHTYHVGTLFVTMTAPESSTVCKSQYETQHAGEARSEARRAKVGGQRTAYPQGKGSGEHRKFPSWGPGPGRQTCIVDTEDDLDLLGQHSSNFKFKRRFALLLAHSIS